MPNPITYTKDELIADMQRVAQEQGGLTKLVYDDCGGHSSSTIIKHFGSWNAGLQAAGLPLSHEQGKGKWKQDPHMVAKPEPKRRICLKCEKEFTSKNGNFRCDRCIRYAEEVLNIADGFEECA